jgi:hypothetical protein
MQIFLFYKTEKKVRKQTKELFMEGEVLVLMHSPKVREYTRAHALGCPTLTRTHSYGKIPWQL